MRERELLERIALGDESAFESLYRDYYPRLIRFLSRFSKSRETIEETINDTLFVVWQNCDRFRGDSAASTWILGIAYKKMLKALSKQKPFECVDNEQTRDADACRDVANAVEQLPYPQAAVVVLCYEFGYSYAEIGQILNCPENTVKTRMFNARRALKSMLEA